jgi:hypothetical protein
MTAGIVVLEGTARLLTGETLRLVALSPTGRCLGLGFVGAVTGVVVGLIQRFAWPAVANRQWILLSTLGLGLGLPGGGLAADLLVGGLRTPLGFGIFLGVAGLLMGLITARAAQRFIAAPVTDPRGEVS